MAANYLHGAETIEIDDGARQVKLVKTAVIGIVGTALAGAVNTPILVTSDRDFAQFGEDANGATILDALNAVYDQKGTVCVVINVLDPAVHKTAVVEELVTIGQDGKFKLAHPQVAVTAVKSANLATTYVPADYVIDARTGNGARESGGAIPASTVSANTTIKVTYTYADATLVTAADIIGGVDALQKRSGMQALKDSYQLFGFYPKILISPVYASLNSVSAELISMAHAIRAKCFIDAPVGLTPQQAITGRGPLGTINFNTSSRRVGLCYPHVKRYDVATDTEVVSPASAFVAGVQSRKDQENGYWWSLSNTEVLGITGLERSIYAMINDANSEANLLNEAGIITFFNSFGTGVRTWGNRSAAYPSDTSAKSFMCVQTVADVIAESIEYFTLQFIDRPLNNAVIDDILASVNAFFRKLHADGALIDGKAWFDKNKNEVTELAAGHLTISYDFMPPTPLERVSYEARLNINYLSQLGLGNIDN